MKRTLLLLGGLFVVVIGVGLFFALQPDQTVVVDASQDEVPGARSIEVHLPTARGTIVRETRDILGGEYLEEDIARAIEELIAGGRSGIKVIPPTTRLLNVFYDGEGEVTLNFSDHLRTDHPGGSAAEMTTLRCLVATVGGNFPGVDRVRVLVDGEVVPTLAGHASLERPLAVKDYR